jgi:5-formyltetrahydrofolate cyclo-ligase
VNGEKSNPSEKRRLREAYLKTLAGFGFHELISKSSRLSDRFFDLSTQIAGSIGGRYVVSFCPFGDEPQINIEKEARTEPYQVGYVRIEDWASRFMSARVARRDTPDLWEEFEINGGARIFQPKQELLRLKPEQIAIILVPGVAFSEAGVRLGRGAGFYDRFLKLNPHSLRVGVAFKEQVARDLPKDRVPIV